MADNVQTVYENPLVTRYASREMASLWSQSKRIEIWRQLWIFLARSQQELGLPISDAQIEQMQAFQSQLNLDVAARYEKEKRHDVMAHVLAYGEQCPDAAGIIHLGATSCFVTDNSDLIMMRESMQLVRSRLMATIDALAEFAQRYANLPCLAYTHFQPAQPTTVGKRATLWAYDFVIDLEELQHRLNRLRARSVKGTTGTQASFLQLFEGDHVKVQKLESLVAEKMGFVSSYSVTGQTYTRKVDAQILDCLGGIAQTIHKVATDIRLLANKKEIEEPFEEHQIGSSAMAYKRNPMRCERMCSLARFVMSLQTSPQMTLATQWFERTLDDSANRRLTIPQAFLGIDACLVLMQNVVSGLAVYEKTIARNLSHEMPFMATEAILMAGVQAGGNRQELHEQIRQHSVDAANRVKMQALDNDLIERLKSDPAFSSIDVDGLMNPTLFVGRAAEQVTEFIENVVQPLRRELGASPSLSVEINV